MVCAIFTTTVEARDISIEQKITGLYIGYFNRAGDKDGLDFWRDKANTSSNSSDTLKELSAQFAKHPLFLSTYSHLNNRAFVEKIYQNSLGKAGDSEGVNFWTQGLDGGMKRSDMVSSFIEASLEGDLEKLLLSSNELKIAQKRQDLITNKVNVALKFTTLLSSSTNVEDINSPQNDPAYLASIKIISDVNEYILTKNRNISFLESIRYDSNPIDKVNNRLSVDWYKPDTDTSWQWQLQGSINSSYDVEIYDIDLFESSSSLIKKLKDNDRKVICYFSAGSYESWRGDKNNFPKTVLGKKMDGWDDERWLDISNKELYPIMKARLDLAVQKGCDGVEPDNVDGYINDTGFDLSASEQLVYNKFIADEAHKRGLSVGLKNDLEQIVELEPFYDFSLNEQCHKYNECDKMQPFIDANKPVLNAEYSQDYIESSNRREALCSDANILKFKTLILPLDLDDSFRYSCD